MANHCYNAVNFTGEREDLLEASKFIKLHLGELYNSYHTLFDIPFDYADNLNRNDAVGVFGSNWIILLDLEVSEHDLLLSCESAWSPCNGFLRFVCEKFDIHVDNEYEECGCDIAGHYTFIDGIEKHIQMTYREYVRQDFTKEMLLEYLRNEVAFWEVSELDFFKDKLTDLEYNELLTLQGVEI